MSDEHEIAGRSIDMQSRARDYRLLDLPSYLQWSQRKLAAGESEATIAHLDATCVWLLPEDVAQMNAACYEEMLDDLKASLERSSDSANA